ncbi:MAG TPA: hypothetical protein VGQ81_16490 [Acidobacteriota bacterium]|jgi:glutamate-ammonia-ligase adenylyltransferase|nr:hypothetical protein [Acidobacteriota bacterium]
MTQISPADVFLAPHLSDEKARRYLAALGFRDPASADANLQLMAEDLAAREALGAAAEPLMDSLGRAPDPDSAVIGLERYLSTRTAKANLINYLREDLVALDLLIQVLGTSPFLSEILIRNPENFHWLRQQFDRRALDAAYFEEETLVLLRNLQDEEARLDALKRFRRREILRIAARDILGKETLQSATAQLSDLADTLVERAFQIITDKAMIRSSHSPKSLRREGLPGSFCVIGMGKLGGQELNYSSDIDLMYVFDAAKLQAGRRRPVRLSRARKRADPRCNISPPSSERQEPGQFRPQEAGEDFFLKLARDLNEALAEHTTESYLYRVDLRLRPMGRGGQIAYSVQQYRHYYETWGETFERFALIKARRVAGDAQLGNCFLKMVQPFVYRKYLDHAALEEIVRIKARADAESTQQDAEQNVKTGRGGIREIELFAQILQILYGGDRTELREPNTLLGLQKLLRARLISESTHEDLTQAYIFLRTVEHRLQIVQERQIHSLPSDKTEREICARRLGFRSAAELESRLEVHRSRVHGIYQRLLHEKGRESGFSAREFLRLLSGETPQPKIGRMLSACGFPDADAALAAIRSLDEVPSFAHSRSASRNLLANLLPPLLREVSVCAEPEKVLNRVEQVVRETGSGTSLFRSLLENELLRARLVRILDSGELLVRRLIRYPELLDSLMVVGAGLTLPRRQAPAEHWKEIYDADLDKIDTADPSRRDDELRRFKSIEEFKTLVAWLFNGSLEECQERLSILAQCCIGKVAQWHDPSETGRNRRQRPSKSGGGWAVFALGKLGSCELTVHSDLDLVFFYRGDPADSGAYLQQRNFVHAIQNTLEQPTSHGVAYRVDTRLRPEGTKGPLAMPLATFQHYLQTRAEFWERLAWTRSRFIAGSRDLAAAVSRTVESFVYGPWDTAIPRYMSDLRSRMQSELSHEAKGDRFDFKVGYGGLADIDFIAQMIQIHEGKSNHAFRLGSAGRLLSALEHGVGGAPARRLSKRDAAALRRSHTFLRSLEIMARMDCDSNVNWIPRTAQALNPLAKRMAMPKGVDLLRRYRKQTRQVRAIYKKVLKRLQK